MKKLGKYFLLFAIGGASYAAIELLWRGKTHWSMVIAGGICLIAFSLLESKLADRPLILRVILAASFITFIEFVFGITFNILLGMNVWSYAEMPYNVMGQICTTFSLLWCGLSFAALPVARFLNRKINF